MYTTTNAAPAVGAVAGGAAAAATESGGAAVLAFTGVALATYFTMGLALVAVGAILRWKTRHQAQHS